MTITKTDMRRIVYCAVYLGGDSGRAAEMIRAANVAAESGRRDEWLDNIRQLADLICDKFSTDGGFAIDAESDVAIVRMTLARCRSITNYGQAGLYSLIVNRPEDVSIVPSDPPA